MGVALTMAEKAVRNTELVRRRLTDPTIMWRDLAAEFRLSVPQARRIWKAHEDDLKKFFVEDTTDYLLIVATKVQSFELLRSELYETAIRARARGQYAAEVGAYKAIMSLHEQEITLLQKTGLLPNDLGVVRVQMDVRKVSSAFIGIFHKFMPAKVAQEAERELLDVLRPSLSRSAIAADVVALDSADR